MLPLTTTGQLKVVNVPLIALPFTVAVALNGQAVGLVGISVAVTVELFTAPVSDPPLLLATFA